MSSLPLSFDFSIKVGGCLLDLVSFSETHLGILRFSVESRNLIFNFLKFGVKIPFLMPSACFVPWFTQMLEMI